MKTATQPASSEDEDEPEDQDDEGSDVTTDSGMDDAALRKAIQTELSKDKWGDFRAVIELFENNTSPAKHDLNKCSTEELQAIYEVVKAS
jgi:hypothetical protein